MRTNKSSANLHHLTRQEWRVFLISAVSRDSPQRSVIIEQNLYFIQILLKIKWERENILRAREWAINDRTSPTDMAFDGYLRKLHLKMFDQTWKWAGQYRRTEKNTGVPFHEIRERLAALLGDVRYWIEHGTFLPDEIAVRFHHRLVAIHPFPNGNGRHARLIADVMAMKLGRPAFTWGATDLVEQGEARARYLVAIRAADNGDIQPLIEFSRL